MKHESQIRTPGLSASERPRHSFNRRPCHLFLVDRPKRTGRCPSREPPFLFPRHIFHVRDRSSCVQGGREVEAESGRAPKTGRARRYSQTTSSVSETREGFSSRIPRRIRRRKQGST